MPSSFKARISRVSKTNGPIVLANDYDSDVPVTWMKSRTLRNIARLHPYLCAIKLNFHLLLPLSANQIKRIVRTAHDHGLQVIADIKLNDIGNTNRVTSEHLWNLGFDAVIANPIMGLDSLKNLTRSAHKNGKGVIALCHMSAPEARLSYDMGVSIRGANRQQQQRQQQQSLYQLFLDWALESEADGVVVGATFPEIIRYCSKLAGKKLGIYSPGVGTQGGDASATVSSGANFLIVGRTVLNAKNPKGAVKDILLQSLNK